MSSPIQLGGLGVAAAGALFWLFYYDLKDRISPEPRRLLIVAFVLGNLAALAALGAYGLVAWAGVSAEPVGGAIDILRFTVLIVGMIEEGAKFAVVRLFFYHHPAFDEPVDGVIYAAAAAIGFATLENALYAPYLGWTEQVARALASPLTHSLFAAIWGVGLSRSRFGGHALFGRAAWQIGTLAAAVIVHGLYDFALLAYDATLATGAISLVLWVGMLLVIHRLTAHPRG